MFTKLSQDQVNSKIKFVEHFIGSKNAADGSIVDANANVTTKNIANLHGEIHKDFNIQINRSMNFNKIQKMFGEHLAKEYLRQINNHEIYIHDESNINLPYTYGAREAIIVIYNYKKHLISMEELYSICKEPEEELDFDAGVWAKYPTEMYIYDKDSKLTKITRLVKKIRHRDLVRVKTAFGEDVIVTDNHPMIIEDDINSTIPALESEGKQQYKSITNIKFTDNRTVDLSTVFSNCVVEENFLMNDELNKIITINRNIELTEELGYFVGMFIADGHYMTNDKSYVAITQNDDVLLHKLASIVYKATGIGMKIYKEHLAPCHIAEGRNPKYVLETKNSFLAGFLHGFLKINHLAQNKNIPVNIFETNEDFAKGVVAGIIDGDGTFHQNSISIRVASRYMVSQLMSLCKTLGCRVSTGYQNPNCNSSSYIKTAYPMFGIILGGCEELFKLSFKCKTLENITKSIKYKPEGWVNITNVDKITNQYFLDQNMFIYDITTESNTFVMNNLWVHNCVAVSLHPFITNGLNDVGGESKSPKHISSFCGGFVNLLLALSGQFAGAVATSEFFLYFDFFARKDYGNNYLETHNKEITQHLQHVVYVINQPAVARNSQSVFWNVSILDKYFFNGMFEHFRYPDNSEASFESVNKLQMFFLNWINQERTRSILTFPVISVSMLSDIETNTPKDKAFAESIALEMERGNSFFIYHSNSVDSLSSCCRLQSQLTTNEFSYTLGNIGVMTGSIHVITLNMNRLIQKYHRKWMYEERLGNKYDMQLYIINNIREELQGLHKYHAAFREILKDYQAGGLLPIYDAGYITLNKQYSTIGINGLVEACEYLGMKISNNSEYIGFVAGILKAISDENKKAREIYKCMFNTEFVPAENLGVKNAKWDREDDYKVSRDCYNSYFYIVEDEDINIIDKFILHGKQIVKYLDGGSALHLNLQEHLTKEQYLQLMNIAIKTGCNYWTVNVMSTCCEDCEHIDKDTLLKCPKCGSNNITYATRIIGYLKKISSFSTPRQIEAYKRHYHKDYKL